ncbi:hypothetical protein RJT34_24489 [Clitoria ternatea]|uniref:C2H2-type domain-containing protein n=1 Tax=Clitoria ternatea TaxID=43366 RepID=A0AAN9FQV2_CLITE
MKRPRIEVIENIDLANCLVLLSQPRESKPHKGLGPVEFECTTCYRKFSSFQALGGHRASHKKPKVDGRELKEQGKTLSLGNNIKPRTHECSVCGERFSQGQALGGHMRKHRIAVNEGFSSKNQVVVKGSNSTRVVCLDLNLTPLQNDFKLLFGNTAPRVDSFF